MNIAFVNSTYKWGGVKTWTIDFAKQLKLNGNNAYIWGRQPAFIKKAKTEVGHGEKVNFGPDFNPFAIAKFIFEFKRKKIQVVFVNIGKDLKTAGIAAKILGIPVIQRIGLPNDIAYSKKIHFLHRWINPKFYCPCKFIRDGFIKNLPYIKKQDTKVILNAKIISNNKFDVNSKRHFICTSQLNSGKGHADLLNALASIQGDFKCSIVGTGDIEHQMHELADSLGLSDKIEWVGFTPNVSDYLSKADVFLLPSYYEGMPNTLLEAMANGLVPVSRDVGGVREVWPQEMNNFLLPYEANADNFKKTIEQILSMPDEAILDYKKISLKTCQEKFELSQKAKELESWLKNEIICNN